MTQAERTRLYLLLGKRILQLRTENKFSQEELGKRTHLSRASIVNIEKGRQHPPLHILWEIADCFGVQICDLLPSGESLKNQIDTTRLEEVVRKGLSEAVVKNYPEAESDLTKFLNSI
jgi:transcriptional regulator with XRE-family HTH domain